MENSHQEPDQQAIKAWQQMKNLLDAELPVKADNGKNNRRYTALLLLLLVGSCGIYKLYNYNHAADGIMAERNAPVVPKQTATPVIKAHDEMAKEARPYDKSDGMTIEPTDKKPDINAATPLKDLSSSQSAITSTLKEQKGNLKNHHYNAIVQDNKLVKEDNKTVKENSNNVIAKSDIIQDNKISIKEAITNTVAKKNVEQPDNNKNNSAIASSPVQDTMAVVSNQPEALAATVALSKKTAVQKGSPKKIAVKTLPVYHFGVEWGVPLQFTNNSPFIDVNAKKQPLTLLIPTLWAGRNLSKSSALELLINPYAQYFLSNHSTLQSGDFVVSTLRGSALSQPANAVYLTQTFSLEKVMGLQAELRYVYQLSKKWTAGAGIANTWTYSALLKEHIVKNSTDILKDSLYGVVKSDKEWQYINKAFLSARISLGYNLKKYRIGASLTKPISKVYKNNEINSGGDMPLNVQLFVRWLIK